MDNKLYFAILSNIDNIVITYQSEISEFKKNNVYKYIELDNEGADEKIIIAKYFTLLISMYHFF